MRKIITPFLLCIGMFLTHTVQAEAGSKSVKNYKRQNITFNNMSLDVQRSIQKQRGRTDQFNVVFLSFKKPAFKKIDHWRLNLNTDGVSIIRQVTGCNPVPGVIPANSLLTSETRYVKIEVTCP